MRGRRIVPATLPDLQRDERGHPVPERGRRDVRPVPADDAARREPVEAGLDGTPGDLEPAGGFEYPDPGMRGQQRDEPGVEVVDLAGHRHIVHQVAAGTRQPVQLVQRIGDQLPSRAARSMLVSMTQADYVNLDELIGAVAHDLAKDPFPVKGIDHLYFVVGNARQASHYYSTAFGMTCVAYRGPEQGYPDAAEYLLTAGSVRFVLAGAVRAGTAHAAHHARHGDGILDIALEVPDVDAGYAYATGQGATGLDAPHDETDEH